ncbi:uncharacterized protein LOC130732918 [Lotus japonicus]|uniref:Uncharacterized protein n=1 Tax=Lotus japonicus TaxID=34305 RepID=I3SBI7_LOTJA|nr:uncharacterized protein LOC130732918 [Lotus japonicus]AFK37629.1 unknown [Lotus japonicus]
MGRQDDDPTMVNSSIALLQERFRQLEKVKQKREGKELVRLLSSSESQRNTSSSMYNPASQQSMGVRLPPHRSIIHDPLSLGLNLATKQGDHDHNNTMKSPQSSNLWSKGASTSRKFDNYSDVDTSLHL